MVLKSNPRLKTIYDLYYNNNSKKFIEIIKENKEKEMAEIEMILINKKDGKDNNVEISNKINNLTRMQTSMYNRLSIGGDVE